MLIFKYLHSQIMETAMVPPTDERIMWYIWAMGFYSARKMCEIMSFARKHMVNLVKSSIACFVSYMGSREKKKRSMWNWKECGRRRNWERERIGLMGGKYNQSVLTTYIHASVMMQLLAWSIITANKMYFFKTIIMPVSKREPTEIILPVTQTNLYLCSEKPPGRASHWRWGQMLRQGSRAWPRIHAFFVPLKSASRLPSWFLDSRHCKPRSRTSSIPVLCGEELSHSLHREGELFCAFTWNKPSHRGTGWNQGEMNKALTRAALWLSIEQVQKAHNSRLSLWSSVEWTGF